MLPVDNCETCTRSARPGSEFCDWCEDVACPVCLQPMGAQRSRMCPTCVQETAARCICGERYAFDWVRRECVYGRRLAMGEYHLDIYQCPKCAGDLYLWLNADNEAAPEATGHLQAILVRSLGIRQTAARDITLHDFIYGRNK